MALIAMFRKRMPENLNTVIDASSTRNAYHHLVTKS